MTINQESIGDTARDEDVDIKGLASFLQVLGQLPESGIRALVEHGFISSEACIPPTTTPIRQQRLGSNVVNLF